MNRILELRNKLRMTQEEFADHCGIARSSIARYEASGNVSRANAEKIARACGVSVSYVIADTNEDVTARTINLSPVTASASDLPHDPMTEWNVQYPAGVALRRPPLYDPTPSLSEQDVTRIAEKVAQMSRDAKTSPVLNQSEQQLVEEYRLLNSAGRIRVQRLIDQLLDNKFSGE